MKNFIVALLILLLPAFASAQQEKYSRVKVYPGSRPVQELFQTGIEFTGADKTGKWLTAEVSETELQLIRDKGFSFDVLVDDLQEYYMGRFHGNQAKSAQESGFIRSEAWPVPQHFSPGSCGGFCTVQEMLGHLDLMKTLYPGLVTVKTPLNDTVTTIEGRQIYYVKISDNPEIPEGEPQVLYTGMHHAREGIGMQHLLFYMWYLLENYATNPEVKALVDHTEMYFIPVVNVDGYEFNIATAPQGGGMWRKNRRDNGNGTLGVDINRNYGYMWGYDNTGSSPNPASDAYRGAAAFSEPETRMMKYFCESHNFQTALNYHSYSNLLLFPWGWSNDHTADHNQFAAYARLMSSENQYTCGPAFSTIYPTNGGSDDWMYGEQQSKPKILSYTPEVGTQEEGFWPPEDRIIPLCRQNMLQSVTAARLTLNYGSLTDAAPLFLYREQGALAFTVKRLGMQEGSFTVSVQPLLGFASVGNPKVITGLGILSSATDSIAYTVEQGLVPGDTLKYILSLNDGLFTQNDTLVKIYGYPFTIFQDKFTSNANWTGDWFTTYTSYFSPPRSMTDSPNGNYAAGEISSTTLTDPVTLNDALVSALQFSAHWDLEREFDWVQLEISDDQGVTWTPLAGKYTHPGGTYQSSGEPLYDGYMEEWAPEAISLGPWEGRSVQFRFTLHSDMAVQRDGFYFDDFTVSQVLDPTGLSDAGEQEFVLGRPFPNPANGHTEISWKIPGNSNALLRIISPSGIVCSEITVTSARETMTLDTGMLRPGVYLLTLSCEGMPRQSRKLFVY